MELIFGPGLQRSFCYVGCQFAFGSPSCTVDPDRPFLFVGRGHQQPRIFEILPIEQNARSQGPLANSDHHYHDNVFDGARDGSVCVSTILRC